MNNTHHSPTPRGCSGPALSVKKMFALALGAVSFAAAQTVYVPGGTSGIGSSPNGFVGVGTSTPTGFLDVNGMQMVHRGITSVVSSTLIAPYNTTDSNRYEIARLGVNQYHWQSTGLITIELFQTYYSAGAYQKWQVHAGYSISNGTARLVEKVGSANYAKVTLGTPVLTGDSLGGYPNQYIPVYIDTSNYTHWRVRLTHQWTETSDTSPESGQIRLFDSPSATLLAGVVTTAPSAQLEVGGNAVIEGKLSIGTTTASHALTVNGTVRAKEVIVETSWADHVFADDYRLESLDEVAAHIQQNRHLPGLPSAAEVAANGISVGEMQARLLEKIEELTLHVIRQERELRDLRSDNRTMTSRIQHLESEQSP